METHKHLYNDVGRSIMRNEEKVVRPKDSVGFEQFLRPMAE